MPFDVVAIPHAAYAALPNPQSRWLLLCLARYADRDGRCWPSMRQLAADARMSLATVCRYLKSMADLGVFHRGRQGVGRYRYTLAEAYVPRWPGRVSSPQQRVPRAVNQEAEKTRSSNYSYPADKQDNIKSVAIHEYPPDQRSQWQARLRSWRQSRFWLPQFGPRPDEPGCFIPAQLLSRA